MRRHFDLPAGLGPGEIALEEAYAELNFPEGLGDRPYTVLNMVETLDGKAVVGPAGTSWGIGSDVDHALFKRIRASCDAQLAGAGVILADDPPYPRVSKDEQARRRAAGLRPLPLMVVVSGRASVPPTARVFAGGRDNVILVVTAAAPPERLDRLSQLAQLLPLGSDGVDLVAMMRRLRQDWGVRHLYSIGGPTLNGAMFQRDLIDELFLTLSPRLLGGGGMPTVIEGPPAARPLLTAASLQSLYQADDELFLRYRLTAASHKDRGDAIKIAPPTLGGATRRRR